MSYKPVPTSQKICVYCNTVYYAKDQRRMYCSSSCNTKAWMARRGLSGSDQPQAKTKPKHEGETLKFSLGNIATIGVGVMAADTAKAGINAVFDVQPTNEALLNEIKALRQENAHLVKRLEAKIDGVANIAIDAKRGIGASNPLGQRAITESENRRRLNSPKPSVGLNPPPPGTDTAGR